MPRPDQSFRRLVADLAGLHPDDLARVLDDLDVASREKVEALLKEFAGETVGERSLPEPVIPPIEMQPPAGYDLRAMSPWLAGLLRDQSPAGGTMTPAAVAALCECATIVHPADGKKKAGLFSRRRRPAPEQVPA